MAKKLIFLAFLFFFHKSSAIPSILTDEHSNRKFWLDVCQKVLTEKMSGEFFSFEIDINKPALKVSIEGKYPITLRKYFRRQLEVANISNTFTQETISKLLDQESLKILPIDDPLNPFPSYFISCGQNISISLSLKNSTSIKIKLDLLTDTHCRENADHFSYKLCDEVSIEAPHPIFPVDGNGLYIIRKLAYHGFLKFNKDNNSYRVTEKDHLRFSFLFPPMSEIEIAEKDKNGEWNLYRHYNNEWGLFNYVFSTEGTSIPEMHRRIQELYDENSVEALDPNSISKVPYQSRVPKINHKIWLTSPTSPREFPDKYFTWLEESMAVLTQDSGWEHWLWIQDSTLLPNTVKKARSLGVTIKVIDEIPNMDLINDALKITLQNKWFSPASDILRYKILHEYGGAYSDTDYRATRDWTLICSQYDFCAGHEPCSAKIGTAILWSQKNHPILRWSLEFIRKLYSKSNPLPYMNNTNPIYDLHNLYAQLGSAAALGIAFSLHCNEGNYRNIVLPPEYVYPTHSTIYPTGIWTVYLPNETPPARSFGVHFWELSWQK